MAGNPNKTFGDAGKIRFAPHGHFYIAPAMDNLTLPHTTAGDPATLGQKKFKPVGYVDEAGVTITPSIETDPINVWQSAVPVLYNLKSAAFQLKATFMEVNQLTTSLFFGADWKQAKQADGQQDAPGVFRLDLQSTPELREFAAVVDWSQTVRGTEVNYRCVIPRAMISDRGAIQLQRTENGKFELTMDALDKSGSLGYLLTDDATMNPVAAGAVQGGGDQAG